MTLMMLSGLVHLSAIRCNYDCHIALSAVLVSNGLCNLLKHAETTKTNIPQLPVLQVHRRCTAVAGFLFRGSVAVCSGELQNFIRLHSFVSQV
jgi:hypothetical protein